MRGKKLSKKQKVASKNSIRKVQKSRKKLWIFSTLFIGILVLVAFVVLTKFSIERMPNGDITVGFNYLAFETPTPTLSLSSPTPTPLIPSDDFVFYKDLSGEEKFAVAYNFTDPILKVSFAYPPGYYMQAIKAEKNDKYNYASVFFAKNGNSDAIKGIRYAVDCELDNRKDPSGLCRESQVRDIEISIFPYKKNAADFAETENCRKEIEEKERILISCERGMSIDMRDRGMGYTLYLLGENPVVITLSVREPKVHAHIIRSILSSATNQ